MYDVLATLKVLASAACKAISINESKKETVGGHEVSLPTMVSLIENSKTITLEDGAKRRLYPDDYIQRYRVYARRLEDGGRVVTVAQWEEAHRDAPTPEAALKSLFGEDNDDLSPLAFVAPVTGRGKTQPCFDGGLFELYEPYDPAIVEAALADPKLPTTDKPFLEAVQTAWGDLDANGWRWVKVLYGKTLECGRYIASYPSYQQCRGGLRKRLAGGLAHDLDFEKAFANLMSQWGAELGIPPSVLPTLSDFAFDATRILKALSWHYQLFSPDKAKTMCNAVLMGASIETAREKVKVKVTVRAGDHAMLLDLQAQARIVRNAMLGSDRFKGQVERLRQRVLEREPSKPNPELSVFSFMLQQCESDALMAAKAAFEADGWRVVSLIFDGFLVLHDPSRTTIPQSTLDAANAAVLSKTRLRLRLREKPFYKR